MKSKFLSYSLIFILASALLPLANSQAQANDSNKKNSKAQKEAEIIRNYAKIDSLLNLRQFTFKAEFNQGSDEVFVVVDSGFAAVQNGNRNNLEGRVTKFEVKKNEKQKTFAVTIMLRGSMSSADAFLFIGPDGSGTATVKSDFPGYFTFNGQIVDFEHTQIYQGESHFLH